MKLTQVILEANVAAKIKDPQMVKQVYLALIHDHTIPKGDLAKLGTKPEPEQVMKLWSDLLDRSLSTTDYGDVSADGKFDEWLTRLYSKGVVDYEDVDGEGGDALGAWKALSLRKKLKPEHQDFNKFKNLRQIQAIVQDRHYRDELERIKDAGIIEKHKKEKKETILIDDDRFFAVIPYNYGSCYTFNNAAGFRASFCTGSSSGIRWFNNYAPDGPLISIVDKANIDDVNGKWQIHAPTNQMNNGNQTISYSRGDEKFAELFPGLLQRIAKAMKDNAQEIKTNSSEIARGGYDIDKAVTELQNKFPQSWNSKAAEPEPEEQPQEGVGTYLVTQIASGRQARIDGESRADIIQKLTTRFPDTTEADYQIEFQG